MRSALHILTDEVHANTVAVGRLAAEQSGLRVEFHALSARMTRMRGRLESVPDEARSGAEDTARHEVEKLRRELEKMDREKADKERGELERQIAEQKRIDAKRKEESRGRNLLIALAIAGPLITHLVEAWSRH